MRGDWNSKRRTLEKRIKGEASGNAGWPDRNGWVPEAQDDLPSTSNVISPRRTHPPFPIPEDIESKPDRLLFEIPTERTPFPFNCLFDQTCPNRIHVHVFELLIYFPARPDVETIVTQLPNRIRAVSLRPIVRNNSLRRLDVWSFHVFINGLS